MSDLDPETPTRLGEYSDSFECEVVVAKLRAEGIEASTAPATARGGAVLPTGNFVWVRHGDLDRARAVVD